MKRSVLSFLLLLVGTTTATTAANSVRLQYHLVPGVSYATSLKATLDVELDAEGLPAEAAASLLTAGKDIKEEVRGGARLDIAAAREDGSLPVEGHFQDLYVRMSMAGQMMESSDMKDQLAEIGRLRGSVSPDRRAVDLILESGSASLPPPMRDVVTRMLRVLPELPDREMKVGDSFEVPARFDLPTSPAGGETNLDGTCAYTLKTLGDREAGFDVRCSMTATSEATHGNMNMTLKGGTRGTAVFDLAEGIFSRMHSDLSLEMAVDMKIDEPEPAPTPAREGEDQASAAPAAMKIRASAKGPIDFTMARLTGAR